MAAGLYYPTAPFEAGFYVVEGFAITLIALANGCLSPSINSLISKNANPDEQGKALGVSMSVGSMGRVIGPYLGGFVYGMAMFMPYFVGALIMVAAMEGCSEIWSKICACLKTRFLLFDLNS